MHQLHNFPCSSSLSTFASSTLSPVSSCLLLSSSHNSRYVYVVSQVTSFFISIQTYWVSVNTEIHYCAYHASIVYRLILHLLQNLNSLASVSDQCDLDSPINIKITNFSAIQHLLTVKDSVCSCIWTKWAGNPLLNFLRELQKKSGRPPTCFTNIVQLPTVHVYNNNYIIIANRVKVLTYVRVRAWPRPSNSAWA